MTHDFDQDYWQAHWRQRADAPADTDAAANPYLVDQVADLRPGTALDAGCGEGAEAIWLAERGWQVTGADISAEALARAARRAAPAGRVRWVEADLSSWQPDERFDLVTTFYAHSALPQLDLYRRLADWVTPGGTLLLVGHLDTGGVGHGGAHGHGATHGHGAAHGHGGAPGHDGAHGHGDAHGHGGADGHGHGGHGGGLDPDDPPPVEATVTAASTAAVLDPAVWDVVTADEGVRTVNGGSGAPKQLQDVVVRAVRRR